MISAEMTTPTLCTRSAALLQTYIEHVALKTSFQYFHVRHAPLHDHDHDHGGGPRARALSVCDLHDCDRHDYVPFHHVYDPHGCDDYDCGFHAYGSVLNDGVHHKCAYEYQLVGQQAFSSSMY